MASYKLTSGPSRNDLLLGLTEKKILWFSGIDDKNNVHRFEIAIISLGLSSSDNTHLTWELNGLIVKKDGVAMNQVPHMKCNAMFNSRLRQGFFREIEPLAKYSLEYFMQLSEVEIREEISRLWSSIPDELKELEEYTSRLNPRWKLIIEALHTWKLVGACSGVVIEHEMWREQCLRGKNG